MLVTDIADTSISAPVAFSWGLRERLIGVVATALDQDEDLVDSLLPDPDSLMMAVEQGVAAGLAANIGDRVKDRQLANAAVRQAVADQVRGKSSVPEATHDFFKSATDGVIAGTVIDPGQQRVDRDDGSPTGS